MFFLNPAPPVFGTFFQGRPQGEGEMRAREREGEGEIRGRERESSDSDETIGLALPPLHCFNSSVALILY